MNDILILDDFFSETQWVSEHLREFQGLAIPKADYPHLVYPSPLIQIHNTIRILSEKIHPIFSESSFTASLRLSTKQQKDQHRSFVHIDYGMNVLIYLQGQEGDAGGTTFYRHKETNCESIDTSSSMRSKLALLLPHDTNDLSRWEVTRRISFRPNRALIFSGSLFHSPPSEYYGENATDGRVTLNLFFPELNKFFRK